MSPVKINVINTWIIYIAGTMVYLLLHILSHSALFRMILHNLKLFRYLLPFLKFSTTKKSMGKIILVAKVMVDTEMFGKLWLDAMYHFLIPIRTKYLI